MSKIRIKNFGPIKEGYLEDDGWLDVKKVTVFIGNQGSGKSTVAKAISTMMWIEKALNRGDINNEYINTVAAQESSFEYQGLKRYFRKNTSIEYLGKRCGINYLKDEAGWVKWPSIVANEVGNYLVPKIMYVPAERNFLSVIKNPYNVKGLPDSLFTFAQELKNTQVELIDSELHLPPGFGDIKIKYNEKTDSIDLVGKDYILDISETSSGFQSFIPLFMVSRFLSNLVLKGKEALRQQLTVEQSVRRNNEIAEVMFNDSLSEMEKSENVKKIESKYLSTCFINIVEEPEQNLFPTSQWEMLKSLLEFNNMTEGNKLIMTTHSPYIINYLTLAVKAGMLKKQIGDNGELLNKLEQVVPLASVINPDDLVIYEMNEKTGTIKKLETYKGLPSDENYLNEQLGYSNEIFSQLLEIEDLCQ